MASVELWTDIYFSSIITLKHAKSPLNCYLLHPGQSLGSWVDFEWSNFFPQSDPGSIWIDDFSKQTC